MVIGRSPVSIHEGSLGRRKPNGGSASSLQRLDPVADPAVREAWQREVGRQVFIVTQVMPPPGHVSC